MPKTTTSRSKHKPRPPKPRIIYIKSADLEVGDKIKINGDHVFTILAFEVTPETPCTLKNKLGDVYADHNLRIYLRNYATHVYCGRDQEVWQAEIYRKERIKKEEEEKLAAELKALEHQPARRKLCLQQEKSTQRN